MLHTLIILSVRRGHSYECTTYTSKPLCIYSRYTTSIYPVHTKHLFLATFVYKSSISCSIYGWKPYIARVYRYACISVCFTLVYTPVYTLWYTMECEGYVRSTPFLYHFHTTQRDIYQSKVEIPVIYISLETIPVVYPLS